MFDSFFAIAYQEMERMEIMKETWQARLRKEYQDTFKMPRKLKKLKRKSILLDWNFSESLDPFYSYEKLLHSDSKDSLKDLLRSFEDA